MKAFKLTLKNGQGFVNIFQADLQAAETEAYFYFGSANVESIEEDSTVKVCLDAAEGTQQGFAIYNEEITLFACNKQLTMPLKDYNKLIDFVKYNS